MPSKIAQVQENGRETACEFFAHRKRLGHVAAGNMPAIATKPHNRNRILAVFWNGGPAGMWD